MHNKTRSIVTILGGFILLIIAAMFAAILFLNPNNYKPQIIAAVLKDTGRQLTLAGPIHWSFFPWVGLQVNQASLGNAPGFGDIPFANVDKVEIKVALLPLLSKKVQVNKLIISGLNLTLVKNAKGITNWQDLLKSNADAKNNNNSRTISSDDTKKLISFKIANIDVNNGKITFIDQQKNQTFNINNFTLQSKNLTVDSGLPLQLQFDIDSNNPALNGHIDMNTTAILNPNARNYVLQNLSIQSTLNSDSIPDKKLSLDAKGTLAITPSSQTLDFPNIIIHVANNMLSGNMQASQLFTSPVMQGKLETNQFKYEKIDLTQLLLSFNSNNKIINLISNADIYGGRYQGNIRADLSGPTPLITADTQLNNIQAQPLFQDLSNITRVQLSGTANLKAHLTMQGKDKDSLIKSLNGQGNFNFDNGVLQGIDVVHWVKTAKALINRQALPTANTPAQTPFGNIIGSFSAHDGVISNNDLTLKAPEANATGKGNANLVTQQIDYQLSIQSLSNGKPDTSPIPLDITGNFEHVSIKPDLGSFAKTEFEGKLDQAKDRLKNHLDDLIQKHKADGNAGNNDSLEKAVDQLLQ